MTRAVAALAFVAAALAGSVPPAAAQEQSGQVSLVAQSPWVAGGGSFDLVLDTEDAAGLDLQITVHSRLRSRSAFVQSLEGRPRGTTQRVRVAAEELPVSGLLTFGLPDSPAAAVDLATLPDLRQGVYPVSVALLDGGAIVDRFVTHLVRLPDDPAVTPLSVAWVQPVGAPPSLRPDGALPDHDRDALDVVLRAVTGNDLDLTLESTPETLGALDETELAPLALAVESGDQLLATPFVDIDPVALIAAGLGDDLPVQRQVGEDALFSMLGTRGDPRTWSAERPLTVSAVARLRDLGVTRLVVPEAALEPLEEDISTTLTRPFELGAGGDDLVRAAAVDSGLTAHFQRGGDQVLAAHHLLADLAVLFFDFPGTTRGVVVRPPARWEPSTAFLDTVFRALAEAPIVRATTLQGLFDTVDPLEDSDGNPVVRRPVTPDRTNALPASRFAEAHRALVELGALAGPAEEEVIAARRRLLVAESVRLRSDQRVGLLDSVLQSRDDVEDRVQLPARRSFRLTAREGTIPLTLVNDNPFPVSVDVVLSSDKLEFTDGAVGDRGRHVLRLELEAGGTHTRTIPVRARASGAFQVRTTLQTTDGQVLRRSQFTVTSSAFSGVGVVLSIGAGLFLLLWWGSHWRTVRRDRRLVEAPK